MTDKTPPKSLEDSALDAARGGAKETFASDGGLGGARLGRGEDGAKGVVVLFDEAEGVIAFRNPPGGAGAE